MQPCITFQSYENYTFRKTVFSNVLTSALDLIAIRQIRRMREIAGSDCIFKQLWHESIRYVSNVTITNKIGIYRTDVTSNSIPAFTFKPVSCIPSEISSETYLKIVFFNFEFDLITKKNY